MPRLPIKGTLLASGAGRVPELRPRFIEAAGGPAARILTIISNDDAEQSNDIMNGWPVLPEFRERGVCEVDIRDPDFRSKWNWTVHWYEDFDITNGAVLWTADRDVADSEEFCQHIRQADGLFFTTGTPSKATRTFKDTKAHQEFLALVERGGAIGGWSAGAMVQAAWTADTEVDPFFETLGFLPDVAIQTHFLKWNTQFSMPRVVEAHPDVLGLGLDERAAIVVHGDEFEVIGSSYVAVFDYNKVLLPDGKFYLIAPGDRYNLRTRQVVGEPQTYLNQLVDKKWSQI